MDWKVLLSEIALKAVGIIFLLISAWITNIVSKYVKNEKKKTTINSFNELIHKSVLTTYQTYVENLKDKNIFNKDAQKTALTACLYLIKENMPRDVEKWLKKNVDDIDGYLKDQIEAEIGELKNTNNKEG